MQQAKGDVKTAIVMQLLGVPCDSAEKLLKQNGGNIRTAVEEAR